MTAWHDEAWTAWHDEAWTVPHPLLGSSTTPMYPSPDNPAYFRAQRDAARDLAAHLEAENAALRAVVEAARNVTGSITSRSWKVLGGAQIPTSWSGEGDALQTLTDALDALDAQEDE